jgi:hypothetical protein
MSRRTIVSLTASVIIGIACIATAQATDRPVAARAGGHCPGRHRPGRHRFACGIMNGGH